MRSVTLRGKIGEMGEALTRIFIGLAPVSLSKGSVEKVTPVGWLASKIDRVARSPGAAEAKNHSVRRRHVVSCSVSIW